MANKDLLLIQNDALAGDEFVERRVNIANGDLLSADSSGIPTVLPAGADTEILSRDITTPTGLKWISLPIIPPTITVISGSALSSGRAVIMDGGKAIYFDPSDESHGGRFFGITKTSVGAADVDVIVQTSGWFNAVWLALTPDIPYYIGAAGTLSTTPPLSGIVQIVGASIDANTLEINSNSFYITI